MKKILINGNFLCRSLTGIERFAFEICARLDEILAEESVPPVKFSILAPANAAELPDYKRIEIIPAKYLTSFPRWDIFHFPKMCRKLSAAALNFSNTAPVGKGCGFAFLHDIYAFDFPEDFTSPRDRLIRAYSLFHYRNIARNARRILTVSQFSKGRIREAYGVDESRISVIPNGWDHFKSVEADDRIFERFPILLEREFFFTLGSLQKRKNLAWILDYAGKHKDQLFAVSGKRIGGMSPRELSELTALDNVLLLGYVSDGEVKSLMGKCRAFVFPSYYEGFGIPPLEALSAGARIIVARAASLPEIYGDSARYIDAGDTDCDLEELAGSPMEAGEAERVLSEFTYKKSANMLYNVIKEEML